MDVVPDLPVVFVGQHGVDNAPRAVLFPGNELIGRHDLIGRDIKIFFGIGCELREEVLRLAVDVCSAKPGHWHDVYYARNRANLLAIINRKKICQRNFVARHDAERRIGRALVDIKTPPYAEHDAKKKQRECNTRDGQQTAPLVTEGGLRDEEGESHNGARTYSTF